MYVDYECWMTVGECLIMTAPEYWMFSGYECWISVGHCMIMSVGRVLDIVDYQ